MNLVSVLRDWIAMGWSKMGFLPPRMADAMVFETMVISILGNQNGGIYLFKLHKKTEMIHEIIPLKRHEIPFFWGLDSCPNMESSGYSGGEGDGKWCAPHSLVTGPEFQPNR